MLLDICSRMFSEMPKLKSCLRRPAIMFCASVLVAALGNTFSQSLLAQQGPEAKTPSTTGPAFEVAAIRASKGDSGNHDVDTTADRLLISNYTLKQLIRLAYDLKSDSQISGGPEWLDKQAFDISAKIDDTEIAKLQQMKRDERRKEHNLLLQSLLADRFQLRAHEVQQVMPVYALVVVKSGPKLTPAKAPGDGYHVSTRNSHMTATATSMDILAVQLTRMPESGDRMVLNRTGLSGEYDFKLDWAPDYGNGVPPDATDPGLFTALEEQLGLKLESQKGQVTVVVVESASKPTLD
jgi:uncharacterized protein (TIGR03435 family)